MKFRLRLRPVFLIALVCAGVARPVASALGAAMSASPDAASARSKTPASLPADVVIIPGPLRSFLRMAGMSQQTSREEVLPLLARNVYLHGYQQGTPTEFLLLIDRYVDQARELQILAGATSTIRVGGCDDAGTLVQILGYRLRQGCGQKNFSLETANPERAFLTIDSGFPLVDLEEALQRGTPFTYSYPASKIPVMFHEGDWVRLSTGHRLRYGSMLDVLLSDPLVARLYMALSKSDEETRTALERSPGLKGLLPFASVLDFYGGEISIRSGRVIVPGGAHAQAGWKELVGASPESPGSFVSRLLAKDDGWLAAYFDTLSRVSRDQQEHLTDGSRLRRLYENFREGNPKESATRGMFRRAPALLVLFTRVQWEPNGEVHVPGDIAVWKEIFRQKSDARIVRDWASHPRNWNTPEQFLEAMTAFSSMESASGPLQIYLMLSEIDRGRQPGSRLSAETVRLLAGRYSRYKDWYLVFTEFPDLDDASIESFMHAALAVDKTSNQTLRGNALGLFQGTVGLWQILARQGQIPKAAINESWQKVVAPYAAISSSTALFDGARASLNELLLATGAKANSSQEEVVDLLAGPQQQSPDGKRVHLALTQRISSVLEDQRLVSLDTLFALSDGLHGMAEAGGGGGKSDGLLPLAAELREFDLPHPIFTNGEKVSWAPPNYTNHHAELQVRTDLAKIIQAPGSRVQLETARGQLAPFLRDTLVGLNYAYYEPPGAQMLHHNPLFVRSQDFLAASIQGPDQIWDAPMLLGAGTPAGGGAYLVGSLADLPYALADTEEDFIAPENIQALIWKEMVPDLLVAATLPRWWSVTPNELHAVALYQRSGEELLIASAGDAQLREKVLDILSGRMGPQRLERVQQSLLGADKAAAMASRMLPAETSYLAAEFCVRFPGEGARWGSANRQLADLRSRYPSEVGWEQVSKDFGVPHPTLAQTNARDLLNVKPAPFFGGYSSRLFGESWESSNLYWARMADEMGYPPVALNLLVPELTREMIARIFATELEDWPALLRAMQETGEEFRKGKIASLPSADTTSSGVQGMVRDATAQ